MALLCTFYWIPEHRSLEPRPVAPRLPFEGSVAPEAPNDGVLICRLPASTQNGGWVSTHEDITGRTRNEARIAHLAFHDPLTDLPNRAALGDHIARAFDRAVDGNETFAVLCIDLDRFKEINDVYGHSAGDRFLAEVGRRLALACDGAFLARLGGDEFTIVSSGGVQPAATPSAMTGSASVRPRPRMACMIAAAGECLPILAFLMKEGCNEVQGYLIGRPQPIDRYRHATAKNAGAPELAAIAG